MEEEETLVLWHINSCPIPNDYDPRRVGPRIRSALKNKGYSGPVTITAIGKLTDTPGDHRLRDLSSTGVALKHAHDIQKELSDWTSRNPPFSNIMLISGPTELELLAGSLYLLRMDLYSIFLAYPRRDSVPAWLWESFLHNIDQEWIWKNLLEDEIGPCSEDQETIRQLPQEKCSQTGESPWSCSPCGFAGQSFEEFSTHLKSKEHADLDSDLVRSDPEENNLALAKLHQSKALQAKTLVWWLINTCPIPDDYEPCRVGPRIKSALRNVGLSGPVTITAIGKLTHTPGDPVLRDLSSTGVSLLHSQDPLTKLYDWTTRNPPPANIMLISCPEELEWLASSLYSLKMEGYMILLAYTKRDTVPDWHWESFLFGVYKEWFWKNLLEDEMGPGSEDQETIRQLPQEKCSQTGESPWSCATCGFACQSFEEFSTHLKSKEHTDLVTDLESDLVRSDPEETNQSKAKDKKRKIGENFGRGGFFKIG